MLYIKYRKSNSYLKSSSWNIPDGSIKLRERELKLDLEALSHHNVWFRVVIPNAHNFLAFNF